MNKSLYMVYYWNNFHNNHTKHYINCLTSAEALREAAYYGACFWVHRVEVWDGDRRMLLAVS